MGRAASGRLEGDAGELDELRFHWGGAYDIDTAAGVFTATGGDSQGGRLTDPSPEGLLRQIRADYAARPVPRSES
jgi:hypothetical protein